MVPTHKKYSLESHPHFPLLTTAPLLLTQWKVMVMHIFGLPNILLQKVLACTKPMLKKFLNAAEQIRF